MQLFLNTALDGVSLGLCYALVALGMYIAYSVLDFADLSTDGTFPLGGVLGTFVLYRLGCHPLLALLVAALGGALCGAVTGLLHVKGKVTPLLSGIIVMTGLLSVTLALTKLFSRTGYAVNIFSFVAEGVRGLFNPVSANKPLPTWQVILLLLLLVAVAKILLDLFFSTKAGFMLTATGNNEKLVVCLSKDPGFYKILGLSLANALSACGGCLYAQLTMQYDNTCGSGKVVLALASVIIGLALFGRCKHLRKTTAVILGALLYALFLNFFALADKDGIYLKLLNAAAFAAVVLLNDRLMKFGKRISHKKEETGAAL